MNRRPRKKQILKFHIKNFIYLCKSNCILVWNLQVADICHLFLFCCLFYYHYLFGFVIVYPHKVGSRYRYFKFQYAVFVSLGGNQSALHIKQHYIVTIGTFYYYSATARIYFGVDSSYIFYSRGTIFYFFKGYYISSIFCYSYGTRIIDIAIVPAYDGYRFVSCCNYCNLCTKLVFSTFRYSLYYRLLIQQLQLYCRISLLYL